jgi:hypothetical protein
MKSKKERQQESNDWNNWKPGSGRKGWSPFTKAIPPVRDTNGHPIGKGGKTDWGRVIQESNEKHNGG